MLTPRFHDDIAIITGAGAGIGRATALRLANEGVAIGVATRTSSQAESLVEECEAIGARACASIGDIGRPDDVRRMHAELTAALGPATILVNNVAVGLQAPFLESDDEHYETVFAVNFLSAVRLTRLALPAMIEQRRGSIINVSSPQGLYGWPGHGAYSASKGAMMAWTRQLANEFANSGVRFNSILPGAVLTPLQEKRIASEEPDFLSRSINLHLIPRMQEPEEVAAAIAFLASSDASFITGTALDDAGGALVKAHWYATSD